MSRTWLITGAGGGLGRNIAEVALSAGDRIVATDSNGEGLRSLEELAPDKIRTLTVDVRDEAGAAAAVKLAIDSFSGLDILINNAGYGEFSPFEQTSSEAFRAMIDVCFHGVANFTRAALPHMRKQRSGTIINVSSLGGRLATAGSASYHAAKWAVGGFTEAVAQEIAPFGVRICALEPGSMRTNWGLNAAKSYPKLLPDYEDSVGKVNAILSNIWGKEKNDPVKVAEAVLRLVEAETLPTHLIMGSDALVMAANAQAKRMSDAEVWRAVSESSDFVEA